MRQTAVKAVPFTKSGAKPQRESEETKNIEEKLGENSGNDQARSRVYYHSEVRTPIAKAMFGELSRGSTPNIRGMLSLAMFHIEAFLVQQETPGARATKNHQESPGAIRNHQEPPDATRSRQEST